MPSGHQKGHRPAIHSRVPPTQGVHNSRGLVDLPNELLTEIMRHAIVPDDILTGNHHLALVARTCKLLGAVATDLLYKLPVLRSYRDLCAYVSTVRKHNHLAGQLQALVCSPRFFNDYKRIDVPLSNRLSRVLGGSEIFPWSNKTAAFLMTLPGLRNIHFPMYDCDILSSGEVLDHQQKACSVKHITICANKPINARTAASRPHSARIAALANMTTALETLVCGGKEIFWAGDIWTQPLKHAILNHTPTLKHLEVVGIDNLDDVPRHQRITLVGMRRLEVLHINYSALEAIDYSPHHPKTLVPLRMLLPESLKRLTLHFTCFWDDRHSDPSNVSGLLDEDYTDSLISVLSIPSLKTFHMDVEFWSHARDVFFCTLHMIELAAQTAHVDFTFSIREMDSESFLFSALYSAAMHDPDMNEDDAEEEARRLIWFVDYNSDSDDSD
ncbi:hypothetical protein HBI47_237460 [Parastagonospora nodorum]|nr:hypothetical protein HBI47_237460 [Parastagonospora nodorum]